MSKKISQADYMLAFGDEEKRNKAFEHALDIRKFEIDLYWKRASYFWTFIAATLAGYAAIHVLPEQSPAKIDLLVAISCLGVAHSNWRRINWRGYHHHWHTWN